MPKQLWERAYKTLRDPRFAAFCVGHGVRDASTLTLRELARLMTAYHAEDRSQ